MSAPWESARLAAWADAFFAGDVAPDDIADAVGSGDMHRVAGLGAVGAGRTPPGGPDTPVAPDAPVGLALALGLLRNAGARSAWLVWPAPGDVAALPGPAGTNRIAVEAGQCVVVESGADRAGEPVSVALVPSRLGSSGIVWTTLPAAAPQRTRTSRAEADRILRATIRESAEALAALDVGRTRDGAESAVEAARNASARWVAPPGFPAPAGMLLDTSQRLAALLRIATSDDGAAVSATAAAHRATVLRDLERAVRHGFVAAVNALAEERTRAR